MRRILPLKEYKVLKKRKSARLTRLADKSKKQNIEKVCMALYAENAHLKAQIEEYKKKIHQVINIEQSPKPINIPQRHSFD